MEEIGVMAIVEGLSSFLGDMDQVNGALDKLRPQGGLIEAAWNGVGNVLDGVRDAFFGVAEAAIRVAETALGVMLRDAIEWAIGQLKDLAQAAIDAGASFQTLELRLKGLNLQTLIDSGMEYDAAVQESIRLTQEQMTWLMKMAAVTPFDATDIANIYTLARSYGFADDAARGLVSSITDFTAGMALDDTAMQRIIINFGQMIQRGKITTREMTDLARGSLVPLQDVLKRVADNMGITVEELTKMIQTADGVPANEFIQAFEEMTTSEVRFNGASERMARTFKGATDNLYQTIRDLFGKFLAMPVLDVLGNKLAAILDAFTNEQNWTKITTALGTLGATIANIFSTLLAPIPSGETLADTFIKIVDQISSWVAAHKDEIIGFFANIGNSIKNDIVPFIADKLVPAIALFIQWIVDHKEDILGFFAGIGNFIITQVVPAFNEIRDWVNENKPLIDEFFGTMGEILGNVFEQLIGEVPNGGSWLDSILGGLKSFMEFVIDNPEKMEILIETLVRAAIAYELMATSLNLVIGAISWLIGNIPTLVYVLSSLAVGMVWEVIDAFTVMGDRTKDSIWDLYNFSRDYFSYIWFDARDRMSYLLGDLDNILGGIFNLFPDKLGGILGYVINLFSDIAWQARFPEGRGWWYIGNEIVSGLIDGFISESSTLFWAVVNSVLDAYYYLLDRLGIRSPSKVFFDMAQNTMYGFIGGITSLSDLVSDTMSGVMGKAMSPMLSLPAVAQSYAVMAGSAVNSTYTTNNQYALSIHTGANTEPIVADFGMLQSLNGA